VAIPFTEKESMLTLPDKGHDVGIQNFILGQSRRDIGQQNEAESGRQQ
jgi:hypothetical protein